MRDYGSRFLINIDHENPKNACVLCENARFAVIDVVAGDARYQVLARNPRHAWVEARDRSARMTVHHLRVLIANEREDRIAARDEAGRRSSGTTVIAGSTNVAQVGALTAHEHPDVALVGLGTSSSHALELIERIVREADCPVIAVLEGRDAAFVNEAAKRGVFAYIVDGTPEELQSALDITLRRFAEYHNLQGAFGRRAQTERAKGILMERYQIDERAGVRDAARPGAA